MILETRTRIEETTALVAFEVLRLCVPQLMALQLTECSKAVAAIFAHVRFLTGVATHVNCKFGFAVATLVTEVALESPHVQVPIGDMSENVTLGKVSIGALRALVWPFAGVKGDMDVFLIDGGERLLAYLTYVRMVSRVGGFMSFAGGIIRTRFITEFALQELRIALQCNGYGVVSFGVCSKI